MIKPDFKMRTIYIICTYLNIIILHATEMNQFYNQIKIVFVANLL